MLDLDCGLFQRLLPREVPRIDVRRLSDFDLLLFLPAQLILPQSLGLLFIVLAFQPNLFLLLTQFLLQPFLLHALLSLEFAGSTFCLALLLLSSFLELALSAGF